MKKQVSILDNLYLAAPCSVSWESMVGNDRERSCSGCSRTVYNISDMPRREAERFLLERGTSECMKFYRRKDATIMTDECPRALRKLRDQCKLATKIAVGIVAFVVSLPAALAQSIETRDTTPIGKSARSILEGSNKSRQLRNFVAMPNGGGIAGVPIEMGKPMMRTPQNVNIPTTNPSTTASVQARIVTKHHTLPNGKQVMLVTADDNGKVVRVDPTKKFVPKHTPNSFIDTRTSDLYSKARSALDIKNFQLAEFYLEKSLEMYDQQKGGDPEFRKHIETELKNLRARNSDGGEGFNNDSRAPGTELLVDPEQSKTQYVKEWNQFPD